MANSPVPSPEPTLAGRRLGMTRSWLLAGLLAAIAVCFVFSWMTSDAASATRLPFIGSGARLSATPSLVDVSPWQTAETLASMAVTSEEGEYARRAERLADHSVDQAFAAALRQASLDDQHRKLTGRALALKQKIAQLEQMRQQDQARVDMLTAKPGNSGGKAPANAADNDALQMAKAQLGLDNDEITDAQRGLQRASGDVSVRVQDELSAHEQSMKKYDSEVAGGGQPAVISVSRNHTLAARIGAWFRQRERYKLIKQAQQQALDLARTLTVQHNALEAKENSADAPQAASAGSDQLASLRDRSTERQILNIQDDRIQTEQQLAGVYAKWADQVEVQHEIVMHLILGSLIVILLILLGMLLCDAAVRRLMTRPTMDRRQMRTLRNIVELTIQVVGIVLILLVIFGMPSQGPTILGLTTAALTIALQDYIVAFLGWFTLVGKNGIHVGDWVEINGVAGEVVEFRLMTTTLLETAADPGLPTGRRISFMNSFAIRGQYFNFSTTGQWTWDEIVATIPDTGNIHALAHGVEQLVREETQENVRLAELEWRKGNRDAGLSRFNAAPIVNLRPSGTSIEIHVRYVTPAAARFEFRNRLYQRVIELLHEPAMAAPAQA